MSIIPAFEIGVWNAWILVLYLAFHPLMIRLIAGKDGLKRLGFPSDLTYRNIERMVSNGSTLAFILLLIYSIFLPLKLGTVWFYTGLPITLLGLILFTIAIFNIANIPPDKPFTRGLYGYSRHPMYVTWSLALIGVSIATASWIFLLISLLSSIPSFVRATREERFCLEKYGDTYRQYLNRTPRWIGIPKERTK